MARSFEKEDKIRENEYKNSETFLREQEGSSGI
jgi:hypothetical protein